MTLFEITSKIIGCAIEVHSNLGPGLLESSYKKCIAFEINNAGLYVEQEVSMPLYYKGTPLEGGYRMDLVVENKIVVEVKCVTALADIHISQTLTYLRLSNAPIGLLINFNTVLLKNGIRRITNNSYKP